MSSSPAEMGILYDLISFYLELVGWTLFFYDYVLQTSREVDLIWKQKATWATIMYMVVRYALFLAYTIPIAAGIGLGMTMSPAQDFCVRLAEWLDICGQISIAVILTLRTFAIYERSLWILALVGAFGLMIPVIGFWICITLAGGSHIEQAYSAISFRSMLLSIFTLSFDIVVIALTLLRSVQLKVGSRLSRQSLLVLVLWHGCLYFYVMSSAHALNIFLYWLAPRGLSGVGVPLSRSISSVLVCRFVLTLRERYYYPQGTSQGRQQQMSPLVIATPSALESGGTQFAQTRFLGLSSFAFEGSFHRSFAFGDGDTVVIPDAL